jgi:outer membrane PBP1 activator LpoA protein
MTGPYPPEYGAGPVGPQMYPPQPYPENVPSPYPAMLPPPLQYPKRRWWPIAAAVAALVVVAVVVAAVVFASRNDGASGQTALTDASAKAAIQDYLDALSKGDDQTVARHTLCGLYDAVKEHRSDLALASLSSDAFRKQYSHAEVTSIDKMVLLSPNQAQVLFTMKVAPASGSTRSQAPKDGEQQAVAQVLTQGKETLVCSYLPRTAGQY